MASVKRVASGGEKPERGSFTKKALVQAITESQHENSDENAGSSSSDDEEATASSNGEEEQEEEDEEEQEEDDDEDDEEDTHSHMAKRQKLSSQDIQIARETAELFKSNIFKLQIDELLEQVKLKESHIVRVEKFLHKLYDMLQEVPEWTGQSLEDVEKYFNGKVVSVPFVDPKPQVKSTQYKFNYLKPDVSLVGSFGLKTAIYQPQGSSVDVLLTMPEEIFMKKDFLNFRCFHKRSVYLAYLTHHLSVMLKKSNLEFLHLEYSHFNNDPLQTVLKVSCKEKTSSEYNFYKTKFSINLIVGFPYNFFEVKKLLPNKNCIRVGQDNETPTPFYNFSVLSSSSYEHYLKFLHKTKKQTEQYKQACVLGKLWLSQRGFSSNMSHSNALGGFGNFEFAALMAALLNGGGLNGNRILLHGFSSYQLFKGVIKYLATVDLCTDGYLQFYSDYNSTATVTTSKYVDEGFQTPTIFDKTTKVNILSKMSVNSYQMLKIYAQESLLMLNDVVRDQFESMFLTNLNKVRTIKYDACYELDIPSINVLLSKFGPVEKISFISFENFICNKLANIVKIALEDRIMAFEVALVNNKTTFPISKRKVATVPNFTSIRIKLLINPAESEKLVTKGPENREEFAHEANDFTLFWGKKASLRRFKDGSIANCCVWSTSATDSVVSSILSYTLKLHLTEDCKLINNSTSQFQQLLPLPNLPASSKTSVLNLSSYYNLKKSFDDLYKIMFELKLPLSIKSLLPIGSAFRYTSLCQPVPYAYSNPDFLQDVVIEFETSTKWPDEITSLEKAKAAFLLKIQESITETHSEYRCFFTRDESIPYNTEIITLNILTPEGYGFKFRVLTERDEVMYLRAINNARKELRPELEKTFLKFTAKYQAAIRHTRTLENISHSYPFYSPVVRLFKKWLDSHLLYGHLPEELVELIAIKPFVDSRPFTIPGSVENGFLKILSFLASWNWREDPLILDLVKPDEFGEQETSIGASELDSSVLKKLSEKLTLAQYKTIQTNFQQLRKEDPQGLQTQFFVASKNDPSGILYSTGVALPIATRLTALAKVAINLIQLHGLNKQTIELLFTPALKDYDFVIKLKVPTPLKLSSGVINADEFKNLNEQLTGFPKDLDTMSNKMDPTYQLVKYLNLKYKNSIIFSNHRHIGVTRSKNGDENVITGLIKPVFKKQLKFKVNMDCNVKPVEKDLVELNKDAIFHEIGAFCQELIVGFEANN
ncbi:unnamed protein product [Kluyveromyces dobzhanskii CBS 2104]|uniref:U3 small nucleolar RNA-associated protein 22 n=1 Tax=Kluyveromyces dobzhanskii CBS 2104 TaxID=1427455 RepID=A0A0A8L716_9SACH|nr:unnamed protein product [Kluyveromyces dobzhanskii CBS 2104]